MTTYGIGDIDEGIRQLIDPNNTRFERELVPSNFLDKLQVVNKQTEVVIQQVAQDYQIRKLGYHGEVDEDPQFTMDIDFSEDDGHTFDSPLINVAGNAIHQIRIRLSQYQVQPPIHGFKLDWFLPNGWVFLDGLGVTTYEEAVSNPMIVARPMRSPVNPQPAGFRIFIRQRYL